MNGRNNADEKYSERGNQELVQEDHSGEDKYVRGGVFKRKRGAKEGKERLV